MVSNDGGRTGLHIAGIEYESTVDGEGVRTAIFLSGCPHHCKGCHNPETWDPEYGIDSDLILPQIVIEIVKRRDFLNGITLSGGDPLYHPWLTLLFIDNLIERSRKYCSETGASFHNIRHWFNHLWIYTGYTFEELEAIYQQQDIGVTGNGIRLLLDHTDVLVDGEFIESLRDVSLQFRGSSNQRLIDVPKSLNAGHAVLWQPNN